MENSEQEQSPKSEAALREERVLEFWEKNDIFQKSLEKKSPRGEFVFYEGPPTANGKPGIHHLEGRAFKDVIPRYRTMRGYHVRRKGGWDTHGLPVELQVEKKLGLASKKAIEEYGIAKFNQECKESVWEYRDLWEKFTTRIGYWVDQKDPYVTYHNSYIESVWNVLKTVEDKKLLYKDYKVLPWCPRCGTALSSHELAQGYEDVKDLSVYVKFKIAGVSNGYFLAWTTTPWTLPGNVALAVGKNIDYVEIETNGEILVLAKNLLSKISEPYEIIAEHKGRDMAGMEYEPLYPFLKDSISGHEKEKLPNAFKIYTADFVTTTDGTGIVHIAPMYGQDDFALGTKEGLPKHHLVRENGTFKDEAGFLAGKFVKDEEVAVDIIKDLAHRGLLFKKEKHEHSYPHCWRCHTPLIYFARDSWYIRMSALRDEMVEENKKIHWEPAHVRDGRFGEWIKDIKDWAISRERYWGTPLPIWHCHSCRKVEVIGSISDLKKKTKSSNRYFLTRHGEAESNILQIISSEEHNGHHLTEKGKGQAKKAGEILKSKNIDLIFTSPFVRTKETAEIIREEIGLPKEAVMEEERIREVKAGAFNGKTIKEYHDFFASKEERFIKAPEGGETHMDIKNRVGEFIYDIDKRYSGKNILIVTHDSPAWLLTAAAEGLDREGASGMRYGAGLFFMQNAEVRELEFAPIPHDQNYELDLHKPYIDEIKFPCDCGAGDMMRVKEVMDVWFDSGAMPFAQDHYPFENKKWVLGAGYPADFIAEGLDQTRGWFYTLMAVGTLMGKGAPYKNVICLGLILDAKGKKMSKSIGNVIDPITMIDKYGVDALRLWMYSVNQPGDSKNFDEKTVAELKRKVFDLLDNVISFYELYRDTSVEAGLYDEKPKNILDKWILAKLNELTVSMTRNLDAYKVLEPVRAIREFIDDLSTWYVRRSRDRIKDGDVEAKRTLYFVLKNLAKLLAPFAPFYAEHVWLTLRVPQNKESIHLTNWPEVKAKFNFFGLRTPAEEKIIKHMEMTRSIVSLGLEARQKAGIKVRQPLQEIRIKDMKLTAEYMELIKDELNVKEVIADDSISGDVDLDVEISEELKAEGQYRELVRSIQDLRKKKDLSPSDEISLMIETDDAGKKIISTFESEIKKTVLAKEISFAKNDGEEVYVDTMGFKIKISR